MMKNNFQMYLKT